MNHCHPKSGPAADDTSLSPRYFLVSMLPSIFADGVPIRSRPADSRSWAVRYWPPALVLTASPIVKNRSAPALLIFAVCSPSISVCAQTLAVLDMDSACARAWLQPMLPSSSALVLDWRKVLRPKFVQPGCTGKFVHPGCTTMGGNAARPQLQEKCVGRGATSQVARRVGPGSGQLCGGVSRRNRCGNG
jgi:hypothetical protein